MADGIIINKADGDNLEKARLAASQFRNALHLFPPAESGWTPAVRTYSGYYKLGIREIWKMIDDYTAFTKDNGYFERRRNEQSKYWMYESINETLRNAFYHHPAVAARLKETEQQVLRNEISSFVAAKRMMDLFLSSLPGSKSP
jgi:LAO/AO transport system kinase